MPCIKIVPEAYLNPDALERLIHGYVFPKSRLIGGLSVDPAHAAEQMHLAKWLWLKENGSQLRHFILSFGPWESEQIKSADELMPLAYEICQYFSNDFQVVFGIYLGRTGLWHIHFVVNSVSFVDGKRLSRKNSADHDLRCYVQSLLPDGRNVPLYYD